MRPLVFKMRIEMIENVQSWNSGLQHL
uniref:Uncharacterized protein n=1 Tax=Anguilla anguilla TaxID=7936 RepID=A0A0E9RKB3_ANGAN